MLVDLVHVTTRDGVRLDGTYQPAAHPGTPDAVCLVHGTGGSFYSSTLFDALGDRFLARGCSVLRINTRGHDLMSTAVTARGGRRLGAAYELVDDCRHDLTAWVEWLKARAGPRVLLLGHSLGAVKCLYALAHEPQLGVCATIAVSPPRLSYSWFCTSPEGPQFLEAFDVAERHVEQGQAATLLEVKLPLPFVVTAGGYVEKYGPDERLQLYAVRRQRSLPAAGHARRHRGGNQHGLSRGSRSVGGRCASAARGRFGRRDDPRGGPFLQCRPSATAGVH